MNKKQKVASTMTLMVYLLVMIIAVTGCNGAKQNSSGVDAVSTEATGTGETSEADETGEAGETSEADETGKTTEEGGGSETTEAAETTGEAQAPEATEAINQEPDKIEIEPLNIPVTKDIIETVHDDGFVSRVSSSASPAIVRKPGAARFEKGKLEAIPTFDEKAEPYWQIDLRGHDLSELDLSDRIEDLRHSDFDDATIWPQALPEAFDVDKIRAMGIDPGLNVKKLHEKGITGKGISVAIIDQFLLLEHVEYADRIKMYEEVHVESGDKAAYMHAPAVASIAVGKNVGVAPEANLYFISELHGTYTSDGKFDWDLNWMAKAIDRVVEVNDTLPQEEKIRVLSISLGIGGDMKGTKETLKSIKAAESKGIYVVYVGSDPFIGMGRDMLNDPNSFDSYSQGEYLRKMKASYSSQDLLIPMDTRCVASPTGTNDYALYKTGGMSWTVPYVAGLYALACQVNPDITQDAFWDAAHKTAVSGKNADNLDKRLGNIINPVELIEMLQKN